MAGTVLQAHNFALVELDEVRVPNAATAWFPARRVNLEFAGEVLKQVAMIDIALSS